MSNEIDKADEIDKTDESNETDKNGNERLDLLINAAINLSNAGETEEAIAVLNKSILLNPKYSQTYVALGLIFQGQGKLKDALKLFKKALKIDALNEKALLSIGLFMFSSGKKTEGINWLKKYLANTEWSDLENLKLLINTLVEMERDTEAIEELDYAYYLTASQEIGLAYARLLSNNGKFSGADLVYGQITKSFDKPQLYYEHSEVCLKLKNYEKARLSLQKAIKKAEEFDSSENRKDWYTDDGESYSNLLGEYYTYLALIYYFQKWANGILYALEGADQYLDYEHTPDTYLFTKSWALLKLERYKEAANSAQAGIDRLDSNSEYLRTDLYKIKLEALEQLEEFEEIGFLMLEMKEKFPSMFETS